MAAPKVIKRSDLSQKDFRVDSGTLRARDCTYHFKSDIGNGTMADFNALDPLLYWTQPTDCKVNSTAKVLFNDGLAYYSYDGAWVLDWFYASSAFVSVPTFSVAALNILEVGDGTFQVVTTGNQTTIEFDQVVEIGPHFTTLTDTTLKVVSSCVAELSWTFLSMATPVVNERVTWRIFKNGVEFIAYFQYHDHESDFMGSFSGSAIINAQQDDEFYVTVQKTGANGSITVWTGALSIKKVV